MSSENYSFVDVPISTTPQLPVYLYPIPVKIRIVKTKKKGFRPINNLTQKVSKKKMIY